MNDRENLALYRRYCNGTGLPRPPRVPDVRAINRAQNACSRYPHRLERDVKRETLLRWVLGFAAALALSVNGWGCSDAGALPEGTCEFDGTYSVEVVFLPPCTGTSVQWKVFHSVRESCADSQDLGSGFISCDPDDVPITTCDGYGSVSEPTSAAYGCSFDVRVRRVSSD